MSGFAARPRAGGRARPLGGKWVGVAPDRPGRQMAVGLAVAGVGGLIASGAWEPSRAVDALATAGAGFMLLARITAGSGVPGFGSR